MSIRRARTLVEPFEDEADPEAKAKGPDGLLYLLTDEDEGARLRIEPAS